jgi:hypothetical protein
MISKFKVGDRVMVVFPENDFSYKMGTISEISDCGRKAVAHDNGDTSYWMQDESLAPLGPPSERVETSTVKGVDPKAAYGATKPSVALVPSAGLILAALAAEDGALKYGAYNYREGHPVEVMTYANALIRHAQAFIDGEDFTSDTGVPNLGGVIMCACILADIMATGVAVDNRPKPGPASKLQDAGKAWKKAVKDGQDPIEAAKAHLGPAMGVRS